MQEEFDAENIAVQIVAINQIPAASFVHMLTDVCDYPVFQDTNEVTAWDKLEGSKDDMFIYNTDSTLHLFLENGGEININMGSDAGYNNVKNAILSAY
ncbi:MAG: hypothetical protein CMH54_01475 [Myxococcales bacterium]|nr:hypothetical protein [Myxococcales bacterium]|tara:strand:- start:508 stop:801 length:294 start_codon:yes stop_codon:yes gene_type:complete